VGGVTHTVDDTPRQQTSVGPDGRFRLERIPVGAWTLFCRRGWRHENEIEITVTANQTIEVNDLRAPERGVSIRGVVLDAAARPVVGLEVDARPRPLSIGSRPGRAKTASDGTFEIEDLAVGNYELSASDDRGQVAHRTVSAGSGDVELRFTEHGLVRGTLSGGWGDEDLPQGLVHIVGLPVGRLSTSEPLQRNGDVYYFDRRLPPGEYRVAARIGPFVTASEATATIRAGVVAPSLDLTLVRGGTVSVVLLNASREPQRGGWVDVPPAWHMGGAPKEPDAAGVFRFESVPPGTWTLKARGRAGVGEVVSDVAAEETMRVEIVLRKYGPAQTRDGSDEDGGPLSEVQADDGVGVEGRGGTEPGYGARAILMDCFSLDGQRSWAVASGRAKQASTCLRVSGSLNQTYIPLTARVRRMR